MPTVLRTGPYRLFFYSGDRMEPPHVHIERDACKGKFWIDPVRYERSHGFSAKELGIVLLIVIENQPLLLEAWNDFFGN